MNDMETLHNTLPKAERLNRKRLIEQLFGGDGKSLLAFPLRMVYMTTERTDTPASMLISVPKKRFKRAVKRNRVKRQVREAYRKNKLVLTSALEAQNKSVVMAFIWLGDALVESTVVEQKVHNLLIRLAERLQPHAASDGAVVEPTKPSSDAQ